MECLRLFEANYPETLKEAYVINGSFFLHLSKISLFVANEDDRLLMYVDSTCNF